MHIAVIQFIIILKKKSHVSDLTHPSSGSILTGGFSVDWKCVPNTIVMP